MVLARFTTRILFVILHFSHELVITAQNLGPIWGGYLRNARFEWQCHESRVEVDCYQIIEKFTNVQQALCDVQLMIVFS